MDCCPPQHTRSGFHGGRCTGVVLTSTLVGFCIFTYVAVVLIPGVSDGNPTLIIAAPLFLASAGCLIVSLYRTMFTHPGKPPAELAPAAVHAAANRIHDQVLREIREYAGEPEHLASFQGLPERDLIPAKICQTCDFVKLAETHHCSTCGECILRMDHHCPWIGQCVGRDNHKYFTLFLAYTSLTAIILVSTALSSSALSLGVDPVKQKQGDGKSSGSAGSVVFFIVWILSAAFGVVLIPFAIMTVQNAKSGTTTLMKKRAARDATIRNSTAVGDPRVPLVRGKPHTRAVQVDDDDSSDVHEPTFQDSLRAVMGDAQPLESRIWWLLPTTPRFAPLNVDDEIEASIRWQMNLAVKSFLDRQSAVRQHSGVAPEMVSSPPPPAAAPQLQPDQLHLGGPI